MAVASVLLLIAACDQPPDDKKANGNDQNKGEDKGEGKGEGGGSEGGSTGPSQQTSDPFDRDGNPLYAGLEVSKTAGIQNCFFTGPIAVRDGWNAFYPGPSMVYPSAVFTVPKDAKLSLEGDFPHGRFFSFTQYYYSEGGTSVGGSQTMVDIDIEPDEGSINPFQSGASRSSSARQFTIEFAEGKPPKDPAPNTLYLGMEPFPGLGYVLVVRYYLPDMNTTATGGVALPEPVLRLPGGETLRGELACKELTRHFEGRFPFPSPAFDADAYLAARDSDKYPSTHPALNPPVWYRVYNVPYNFCLFFTPGEDCIKYYTPPSAEGPAGFGNPANGYLETWIDQAFGEILVLRAKKPLTPATYFGNEIAAAGQDMRFFSVTTTESFYTWSQIDDVFDEEIPVDENGDYTIVVSRPWLRPNNANYDCGVAWLEMPPGGDGFGDGWLSRLVLRNTLPNPDFPYSVTNVKRAGNEAKVMGDYYPVGNYMSKAAFEELGCPAKVSGGE